MAQLRLSSLGFVAVDVVVFGVLLSLTIKSPRPPLVANNNKKKN